jgi:hypothetical protein
MFNSYIIHDYHDYDLRIFAPDYCFDTTDVNMLLV